MIVCDDCSKDDTVDVVKRIAEKCNKVILLESPVNKGAAFARNTAISSSSGRFIAFLDSDDVWEPKKLELQIKFMLENQYVFTYTYYYVEKETKTIKYTPRLNVNYKQCLYNNPIGCLTAVYDSHKLGKVYMPTDAIKREDYAAWLTILKGGIVAYCLDEYLSTYRISKFSVSSNKRKMIKYQYNVYRNIEKLSVLRSIFIIFIYSIRKIFKY